MLDDDPHTLRYLRDTLSAAGYDPIVTGEHQELSRIIRAKKPHLVLLDLVLPGTDGIELMERVPELAVLSVEISVARAHAHGFGISLSFSDASGRPCGPAGAAAADLPNTRHRT